MDLGGLDFVVATADKTIRTDAESMSSPLFCRFMIQLWPQYAEGHVVEGGPQDSGKLSRNSRTSSGSFIAYLAEDAEIPTLMDMLSLGNISKRYSSVSSSPAQKMKSHFLEDKCLS